MTRVQSVRASVNEWAAWKRAAGAAGLAFNAWARRALNEQADFETAVRKVERDGKEDEAA